MIHAAHRPSPTQQVVWHLSLLGHRTLDLAHFATRTLPACRLAIVASLLALLAAPAKHLTVSASAPASGTLDGSVARAGLTVGSPASLAANAPTRAIDDATALEAIERLGPLAQAEADRMGLDAGVLLAAAIVSAPAASANGETVGAGRVFGSALDHAYATPTQRWRAMGLTLLAEAGPDRDRASLLDAAASLYPTGEVTRAQLAYLLQRYSL